MDLHKKIMMMNDIRENAIKAESEFLEKIKELEEELDKRRHSEFEKLEAQIEELVKDIPEDEFGKFATACLGTMSDNLNSLMIASYVKVHEKDMHPVRKHEFLIMSAVSAGVLDAKQVAKDMGLFPDGFDE